jgi:hemerythrin
MAITKEDFLKIENEDEVWGLIETFMQYWKEQFMKENPQMPRQFIYDYLPTDRESYEIVIQMIKNNR